jgi:hypothetical protein
MVEVSTICGNARHSIRLVNNRLVLVNHPHATRDLLLQEFGTPCRCLAVLAAWRAFNAAAVPEALQAPLRARRRVHRQRYKDNAHWRIMEKLAAESPRQQLLVKLYTRTHEAIVKLFGQLPYRHFEDERIVLGMGTPAVKTRCTTKRGHRSSRDWRKATTSVRHAVIVPRSWLRTIFRHGRPVHNDELVLAVNDTDIITLAQARGYRLKLRHTRYKDNQ